MLVNFVLRDGFSEETAGTLPLLLGGAEGTGQNRF